MPAAETADGSMVPAELQALVAPHIDSYNYFIGEGMQEVVQRLDPIEVTRACVRLLMAPESARAATALRCRCARVSAVWMTDKSHVSESQNFLP